MILVYNFCFLLGTFYTLVLCSLEDKTKNKILFSAMVIFALWNCIWGFIGLVSKPLYSTSWCSPMTLSCCPFTALGYSQKELCPVPLHTSLSFLLKLFPLPTAPSLLPAEEVISISLLSEAHLQCIHISHQHLLYLLLFWSWEPPEKIVFSSWWLHPSLKNSGLMYAVYSLGTGVFQKLSQGF